MSCMRRICIVFLRSGLLPTGFVLLRLPKSDVFFSRSEKADREERNEEAAGLRFRSRGRTEKDRMDRTFGRFGGGGFIAPPLRFDDDLCFFCWNLLDRNKL